MAADHFNFGALFVKWLADESAETLSRFKIMMRKEEHNYNEVALDFVAAGLHDIAERIWTVAESEGAMAPMSWYYRGWNALSAGDTYRADADFARGSDADSYCCFPNRLEAILALRAAIGRYPEDAMAHYYLGNLYYDKRQYDIAREEWEAAAMLKPEFPTVWRNLALVYFNKCGMQDKARECMEKAFALDRSDSRILMELDQLYKRLHRPHEERLAFLRRYPEAVDKRDDLTLELITLLNLTGNYSEAKERLDARIFHPWEGGEGKVPAQYQAARVGLARIAMAERRYVDAVKLLEECLEYPHHLGEGKLYGAQENDFYYLLGITYSAMGMNEKSIECWTKATEGPTEPAPALYYNDAKPDKIFYAGLAYRALGQENKARSYFNRLADYGRQHYYDKVTMDYFAVSLPDLLIWEDSLDVRNRVHCLYMLALGLAGLGETKKAVRYLEEAAALDPNHQGIKTVRPFISGDAL